MKKNGSSLPFERVEKVDTLLDGNAARSKIKDFRTALYPRQYHPSVLEKPLYSAVFRLQGVFPPHMSAKKQKCANNTAKENFRLKDKLKQETARLLFFMFLGTLIG